MVRALALLLFFLSGAAALVYEVTWARSLGLVFGGSHLAVTSVLAVYMGGQALGAALVGRRADRTPRPLRLYGLVEIGVGLFTVVFLGLMRVYPHLYGPAARVAEESAPYLTVLRVLFAVVAMIVPTTLMGGTLPLLARFVTARGGDLDRRLSGLYAFNTFGAVAGSLAAGFWLLEALGVTRTLLLAGAVSVLVGLAAIWLQGRAGSQPVGPAAGGEADPARGASGAATPGDLTRRLILAGIGVSGFCALGYELLWTRMLTLVVGTSVYSFTIMLVAFLSGIGLGSHAYGLVARRWPGTERGVALRFAAVQVGIGASAGAVTVLMRDLPGLAGRLHLLLLGGEAATFGARTATSFAVAFAFLLVPALLMGFAFPAAAAAWGLRREASGQAVGRLLTVNTGGAILGSAVTGFALVYLFGIERSLQMLVVGNVACGLLVAASTTRWRAWRWAIPAAAAALLVARAAWPDWGRAWDRTYFAAYTNTMRTVQTAEQARSALAETDVLYYHEGVNETVSVIRPRGAYQTFIVNGRPEASTAPVDVACQQALGHLPMLLHPNPRRVFVLGTGSGMTLGATSVHPEVERIVLGEIEAGVLGVARTFGAWNAHVLDNPKLHVVFNDGRNYLSTTREQFDVITADPIHPWSGGAAYLYTAEYFQSVASRLAPGGVAAQWLPLYELSDQDLRTVVRSFAQGFRYVMVWLTHMDAELVGSNEPFVLDEAALERRIATPAVRAGLAPVQMGSAQDLLGFFVMGTAGATAFAGQAALNTDDGLALEFSAPRSQGQGRLIGDNVMALSAHRESLLPYLAPAAGAAARREQVARWTDWLDAARRYDAAHALFLWGEGRSPEFDRLMASLGASSPDFSPYRFLAGERAFADQLEPALVAQVALPVREGRGAPGRLRLAAVRQFLGPGRVLLSVVDAERREIFGQRYLDGEPGRLEEGSRHAAAAALTALQAAALAVPAPGEPGPPPREQVAAALRAAGLREVGRIP